MAARATLALKAGVWLRRGLLLIVSPVRGYHRRYQAETPLIDLFKFAEPALRSEPAATLADPHRDGADIENNREDAKNSPAKKLTGYESDTHHAAAEPAFAGTEGNPVDGQRKAGDQQRRQQVLPFPVSRWQGHENSGEDEHQPGGIPMKLSAVT